ncbi:hypothetical protein BH10PAT2_BH10PAT2_1410 [soil metagenome]
MAKRIKSQVKHPVVLKMKQSHFWSFSRFELLSLLGLFFLAIFIRFLVIKNNNIFFFFDQSRDATSAYEITHGHPIKVQGPSASGTGDSVYHGVLYYYVIAPAYALGNGDPFFASMWLGILTSFTIFPLFLLAKSVSKSSQVGYLAAFLFAISFEAAQMGTWLSNPGIAVLTLTCFYLFIWRIFYEQRHQELPLLALFLGLCNQSIIYSAYLWIILGILYFFNQNRKVGEEPVQFSVKEVTIAIVVYAISISTMLVNQLLLYKHGLFNPFKTAASVGGLGQIPFLDLIKQIFELFLKNISYVFFPTNAILSIILLAVAFILLKKYSKDVSQFLWIWYLAPLALLLFIFRNGYHVMIGSSPMLYLLLALALHKIWEMKLGKVTAIGIMMFFIVSQLAGGKTLLTEKKHLAGLQEGTYLQDEMNLIDKTYEIAGGKPFSISSLTIPYGYDTTWAYLYHWYGLSKYGYLPSYVGSTQSGILGSEFLTEKSTTEAIHFSIQEPTQGLPEVFNMKFGLDQQALAGTPSAQILYGSLRLQVRDMKSATP